MSYQPRLKDHYRKVVVPKLMEQFGYKSIMQVPRIEKICINQGVGAATQDKKLVDNAVQEMSTIAGQKAVITKARKSVSNFKLREGMPIGARVTLRHNQMFEFLDRLVSVALPRVRDFRGINDKSFDGRGNYTMGVTEQIIFPEIDPQGEGERFLGQVHPNLIVFCVQRDSAAVLCRRKPGLKFIFGV